MLASLKQAAIPVTGGRPRLGLALCFVGLGLGELALVRLLSADPAIALGVAGLALALSFVIAAPSVLLVAVFPATFALGRIASGGFDASMCDLVTALALLAALPFVPWHDRALRRVLGALAFYLALLTVAVLANPSTRAAAELGHRAVLFGGAVLIGAVVAHRNHVTAALRAVIAAASVVSVAAVIDAISSGFEPAFAFGLNKNGAGPLLAICALLLFLVPERIALPRSLAGPLLLLILCGLLATQSRGAGLALVAAVAINTVRRSHGRRRRLSVLVLVGALVVLAVSVVTLRDEDSGPNAKFNGVNTRTDYYDFAIDEVWAAQPVAGAGLKWFRANGSDDSGPHNIAVAELSEAGVVGTVGLAVLVGTTLAVLWKRRSRLGQAAAVIFIFEILYAMTSIFWVAGVVTLPLLVVGLGVLDEHGKAPPPAPTRQRLMAGR